MKPGYFFVTSFLTGFAVASCVSQPKTTPNTRTDLIVLLPDAGTGIVGRASVSNARGRAELAEARAAVKVGKDLAPVLVKNVDDAELTPLTAVAFAALPPPPQHVMLNFQFDSDELTDASRALLPEVLRAVKSRPVPEVLIIGHTDTSGTSTSNITLGFKRADMIRKLLVEIGLEPSLIETVSHGEADLLVRTADEVPERRNRRVEITVR